MSNPNSTPNPDPDRVDTAIGILKRQHCPEVAAYLEAEFDDD
ncbi:MAG: hypothetical protein V5A34_05660 [Halapricum sp.]